MNSSRAIPLIFLHVSIFVIVLISMDQKRQVSANKGGSDIILYKNNLIVRANNKGKGNKGKGGGSIVIVNGGHKHHGHHGYGGHEHHGYHHGHHKDSFEQNLVMSAINGGKGKGNKGKGGGMGMNMGGGQKGKGKGKGGSWNQMFMGGGGGGGGMKRR